MLFSFSALIISILSLAFAWFSWKDSHRPIVVAYVIENSSYESGAIFELVLENTGNRPAKNIKIKAKPSDIEKIFEASISRANKKCIYDCFKEESEVALLSHGRAIKTAFGHFTKISNGNHEGIKFHAWLPIEIIYEDLNSKHYKEKLTLRVRGTDGFGGSVWVSRKASND